MGELSRQSYLAEALREAIGFLEGLALGLTFYTGTDREKVASGIRDEVANLAEALSAHEEQKIGAAVADE